MGIYDGYKEIVFSVFDFLVPRPVVNFLNQTIIDTTFIWLNYWSFVHFFSGVLFYFLLKGNLRKWIIINIVFEIVEFILGTTRHPLFFEEFIDIIWDIIWGIGGFLAIRGIIELRKRSFK